MEHELTFEPRDLVQIVWRQRWQILLTFVLVVAGTLVATYLTRPLYSATSKVLLETNTQGVSALSRELYNLLKPQEGTDVQLELIRSRPIVERALRQAGQLSTAPGQPGITPEQFQGMLKVRSASEGSNIFLITVQDGDPQRAARLANSLADTYVQDNFEHNRTEVVESLAFIEKQLAQSKVELTKAEEAMQAYQVRTHIISLPDETRALVDQAAQAQANLNTRRLALEDAATRETTLSSRLGLTANNALGSVAVSYDPGVQSLRSQLFDAENKLKLMNDMTPNHPDVLEARARVRLLRDLLATEVRRVLRASGSQATTARTNLDPISQSLTQDLVRNNIDRIAQTNDIAAAAALDRQIRSRLSQVPAQEVQMARLMRNAEVSNNIYKMLLQKREEVKLLQPVAVGNARVIEPALPAGSPDVPKKGTNLMLGIVAGLGLGLGFALLLELLDDTVRTTDEARDYLKDYPLLGLVPWFKDQPKTPQEPLLYILSHPRSPAAEAIRTLRTNIRFLSTDHPIAAFTITSSMPEEGKSRMIANLAVSMAQAGKRVVLVDCDLRNPVQHILYRLSNAVGLTNALMGDMPLEKCLQPTAVPGVMLLASGPLPPNPLELLESNRMRDVITELRARFDYVLCDGPAIGAVHDSAVLATHLDGLIYLAAVERVSRKGLRRALELLKSSRVRILGTIIRQRKADENREYGYYYRAHETDATTV